MTQENLKTNAIRVIFLLAVAVLWLTYNNWGVALGVKDPSPQEIAKEVNETCVSKSKNDSFKTSRGYCYSEEFSDIAYKYGPDFSFKTLDALQEIDSSAGGCHFIAHGIGYGTFKRNPDDWSETANNISRNCGYGAIHGIMEKYFNTTGKPLTQENITSICGDDPKGACNHGVGHLTLIEARGDINKALNLCGAFENNFQKFLCKTGTFMENIIALNLIEHGLADESWLNWDERLEEIENLCRQYEDDEAAACWREVPHAGMQKFKNDIDKMIDMCNTAQNMKATEECTFHAINSILLSSLHFDMEKARQKACNLTNSKIQNFKRKCETRIPPAYLMIFPNEPEPAINYCLSLSNNWSGDCLKKVHQTLEYSLGYSDSKLKNICEKIPDSVKPQKCR